MDKILEESTALDSSLLIQDEEQYDKLALALASKLSKLPVQDLAANDYLDVCYIPKPGVSEANEPIGDSAVFAHHNLSLCAAGEYRNLCSLWENCAPTAPSRRSARRIIMALHCASSP